MSGVCLRQGVRSIWIGATLRGTILLQYTRFSFFLLFFQVVSFFLPAQLVGLFSTLNLPQRPSCAQAVVTDAYLLDPDTCLYCHRTYSVPTARRFSPSFANSCFRIFVDGRRFRKCALCVIKNTRRDSNPAKGWQSTARRQRPTPLYMYCWYKLILILVL